MSSQSELISNPLVMKSLPSEVPPSSRNRKSPQSSTSIYVPPPLRKRKNSSDSKKNSSDVPTQKNKLFTGRNALHLTSQPNRLVNKSKKCENSYMLFGLEDKSNVPSGKPCEKVSSRFQGSEVKERSSVKEVPGNTKKCDNSFLLFSSVSSDNKSESSCCSDKIVKKQNPSKTELNGPFKVPKNETVLSKNSFQRNHDSESLVRVKSFESIIVPYLPEELSCGLGSLSVGNKSSKYMYVSAKDSKEFYSVKQSSQKKCDDSSILFNDDLTDIGYSKIPSRDKFYSSQNTTESSLPEDRVNRPSCLNNLLSSDNNSCQKPLHTPLLISNVTEDLDSTKDKKIKPPLLQERVHEPSQNLIEKSLEDTFNLKPSECNEIAESIEDFVIEIYDFPKTLRTQDMMTIFSAYVQDGFFIRWVDDSHALGVFPSPFLVTDALKRTFDLVSIRSLKSASAASIDIASTLPIPTASRPRTCPSLARRLVSGALGLKVLVSDEIRQAEKKILQDAKEERRLAAKQREEAWEGTLKSNLGT